MDIKQLIFDTLKPLGIKTAYQTYSGADDKYIMFGMDEDDSGYEDDEATEIVYNVQLNYWCTRPQDVDLYKQIKKQLKSAGFIFDGASDRFDDGYYGKQMEYIYTEYL